MFEKLSGEKISCGLDVGSQSLKACLLQQTETGAQQLIGAYQTRAYGYKNGSVSDLNDFADSVYQAVNQLSSKTGKKIKDLVVGVDGALIEVRRSDAVIPLVERGSKVITASDIDKVNKQARILGMKMEEETLHDLPQSYEVDDMNSVLNPAGLYGRKLGLHALTVVADINRLRNISKAVNQAGYDIERFCFSGYMAGKIALTEKEMAEGCILIEIGAKKTGVFMYFEGVLRYYRQLDFGGEKLTYAIAQNLNLPFELAEEIKQSYAEVGSAHFKPDEEILVKKESAYMPVCRQAIYDAVAPVAAGFADELYAQISTAECYVYMNHGFVLSGGGSLLSGIMECFEQRFHKPVRLAQAGVFAAQHSTQSVLFLPAVALAKDGLERERQSLQGVPKDENLVARLMRRFQVLYQEYF